MEELISRIVAPTESTGLISQNVMLQTPLRITSKVMKVAEKSSTEN